MTKKSIDRKAATQFVLQSRNNGKTDQEIYNELTQEYYDKKAVALLITGTPIRVNKEKYHLYNNLLLSLIGSTIVLKILTAITLFSANNMSPWSWPFILIVPLINIYFLYEIARYNAPAYRFCGFLTIVSMLRAITNINNAIDLVLTLILGIAIAGLAFYLDDKLFPKYRPNRLRKDRQGEFML